MSIKKVLATLAGTACLGGFGASHAAVITQYTSLSAFQTAAGSTVVEDFADTTLLPGLSISFGGSGNISGGQVNDALAVFGLCIDGGVGCPATTIFNLSPGTTAFGADWDLAPGGAGSGIFFSVTLAGGATQQVSPGIVNPAGGTFSGFFGFVSDTAITQIRLGSGFTGNGETFNADNVRISGEAGPGGTVPEPATLALFAAGLAAMGLRRSKRAV